MSLSETERLLLEAADTYGRESSEGYSKCAVILRRVLESEGDWNAASELAVCNSGYEHPRSAQLYDGIRTLVENGILEGRGDLNLPAGPRYTECRLSAEGIRVLLTGEPTS